MNRFARDYVRYDRKWETRLKVPESMKGYVEFFHFKKAAATLAYYALENSSEMTRLIEVLGRFER